MPLSNDFELLSLEVGSPKSFKDLLLNMTSSKLRLNKAGLQLDTRMSQDRKLLHYSTNISRLPVAFYTNSSSSGFSITHG